MVGTCQISNHFAIVHHHITLLADHDRRVHPSQIYHMSGGESQSVSTLYCPVGGASQARQPCIIDQHFTQRNRNHRLLTAVMDNPRSVGVGISEGTIFTVRGRRGKVLGLGPVHIYDARKAKIMGSGPRQSAERIQLPSLHGGDSFSW